MGKNDKASKSGKRSKQSLALETVSDTSAASFDVNETNTTDVIAGFDFLKSFVSDDLGDSATATCLRKMAKKDVITKMRALQEFLDLLAKEDVNIEPYLQFWSRCYCRLTMCSDHRVRELAQKALAAVMEKSGKQFAGCIRIVLPYCILSHSDCVTGVSFAAQNCFESSFNESRRIQAINLYKLQIYQLVSSIIDNSNPYISDKSLGLDEEEVVRKDRLLAACLGAWSYVNLIDGSQCSSSDEDSDAVIANILSSSLFSKSMLSADSVQLLSALHMWTSIMCKCKPELVRVNKKLFNSIAFLSPPETSDASTRTVDVGCWQSAVFLLETLGENVFWQQSKIEALFSKRMCLLLTAGPLNFQPPPAPFIALPNIPKFFSTSKAVTVLFQAYLTFFQSESSNKLIRRLLDSCLQGFKRVKAYHSRSGELARFCHAYFGIYDIMLNCYCKEELKGIYSKNAVSTFSIACQWEPTPFLEITPYFHELFLSLAVLNHNAFPSLLNEELLRQIQLSFKSTEQADIADCKNLAVFVSSFKAMLQNVNLSKCVCDFLCFVISSLHTPDSEKSAAFLANVSSEAISSLQVVPMCYDQLKHEFVNFSSNLCSKGNWTWNEVEIASNLLLRWDFLLPRTTIESTLEKMHQPVNNIEDLLKLVKLTPQKHQHNTFIVSSCEQLLTPPVFLNIPEKVTVLLGMMPATDKICNLAKSLLISVVNTLFLPNSDYYISKLITIQEQCFSDSTEEPIEMLVKWLAAGKAISTSSCDATMPSALASILNLTKSFPLEETEESFALILLLKIVAISYCCDKNSLDNLLSQYSHVFSASETLKILKDVTIFNKETFRRLVVVTFHVLAGVGTEGSLENNNFCQMSVFEDLMQQWKLSHSTSIGRFLHHSEVANVGDIIDEKDHIANLIFFLGTMLYDESQVNFDILVEAASIVELKSMSSDSSWLDRQLMELVDEVLMTTNRSRFLPEFVKRCRENSSKQALCYLSNKRHQSSAEHDVIECLFHSIQSDFCAANDDDLWFLALTVNRYSKSSFGLPGQLSDMLGNVVLNLVGEISNGDGIDKTLRSLTTLTPALNEIFISTVEISQQSAEKALAAINESFSSNSVLQENESIELEDVKLISRLDASADLAILFHVFIRYVPKMASVDAMLCSLCYWIAAGRTLAEKLSDNPNHFYPYQYTVSRFLIAVLECVYCVNKSMISSLGHFHFQPSERQKIEFTEFYQLQFLDSLLQLLISLWLPSGSGKVSLMKLMKEPSANKNRITMAIVSCIQRANFVDVIDHVHLDPLFCADESHLPEEVQTLIGRLSPLIGDKTVDDIRVHQVVYTVLSTLNSTLNGIYLSLSDSIVKQSEENDDEVLLTPPQVWIREISSLSKEVLMLAASDEWRKYPTVISSYFYVWLLVLKLAGSLPSEIRPPMLSFLRKSEDFNSLLYSVFALAPADPKSVDPAPFNSVPQIENGQDGVPLVGHLACIVIKECLVTFPAAVRSWLNDQSMSIRRQVIAFVSSHLSPELRALELSSVRQAEFDEAISMRTNTATGELMATYKTESIRLELTIALPADYPLSPPTIECNQNVLNKTGKLWLRRLTALLICQNGALLDALLLWQKLITDKLGKIEECTICYSIFQGGNFNLPKRQCRTCKKLFHSACLFKWFETSGNVTCPLCREQFY